MHHFNSFDMIKFDKRLLTKPQLTRTRTCPPPSIEQTAPLSYALCTEVSAEVTTEVTSKVTTEVTTAQKGLLKCLYLK